VSGPDIFISYSREERSAARHFAECFTNEGFAVWWDAALRSGETFDEVIERELRAAKAVVVLWSPRSVASRWVRAEATLADRANKLVPVIIESCSLPIIFELTQAADMANWTGDTADNRWQMLVSDLRRLIDPEGDAATPRPTVQAPAAYPRPAAPAAVPAEVAPKAVPAAKSDDLSARLERIGKAQEAELAKPTKEEVNKDEFFKWSDEYREGEAKEVHCLRRLDGEDQETCYRVTPDGLSIGRAPPSDIIVSGVGVSRAHCLIELAGDQVRVTDLNSTNGTFIDNKRVDRSANFAVGSVLRVGSVSFEHEIRQRGEATQGQPDALSHRAGRPEGRLAGHS
jgi:hypothetical protein